MIVLAVVVSLLTAVAVVLWRYSTRPLHVLRKCGVPIVPGALPFIGHTSQVLNAEHHGLFDFDNVKKYGKVHGVVEFCRPVLVVTDADVLKEVLLKQFQNFTDRRSLPLRRWMKLSMFDQKGEEWKRIRAMLTPFFSLSKLRHNVTIMQRPVERLMENLKCIHEKNNIFDAHSVSQSFSLDAICATAFGLHVDSQSDPDNQLLMTLRTLSNVSVASPLIFLTSIFPFLSPFLELFNFSMFPSGYLEYVEKVTKQLIDERKNSVKSHPDFVQAMVKAHLEDLDYQTKAAMYGEETTKDEDTKRGLNDREIMAQVLVFFLGGYDTTARTLSMFLYNMARYPQIQNKLYEEIVEQVGEKVPDYETILRLKYLDMCLRESLRLYPPAFRFDREAVSDVTIGGIEIPKQMLVVVPVWAIHHDPDLWPLPDTFDPERFSAEARTSHCPLSYLPFGTGLRSCIGSRFAQLELKLAIIEILRSFRVIANNLTPIRLQMENTMFLQPTEKLLMSLQSRTEKIIFD